MRLIIPLCGVQGGFSSCWQRLHKGAATAFMNAQQLAPLQADHNNRAAEGLTRVCGPRSHCIPAVTGPGAALRDPALALMHSIGRFQLFKKTQG